MAELAIVTYDHLPEEAAAIRRAVFMDEQGFEEEFDAVDDVATHLVGFIDGRPVATARFYWNDEQGSYAVGRIAVDAGYRGRQLGAAILAGAERAIRAAGGTGAVLAAQVRAGGFYRKQGYEAVGKEFLDEGCPHVWMHKELLDD